MALRAILFLLPLLLAVSSVQPFSFNFPFFDPRTFFPQPFRPKLPDDPQPQNPDPKNGDQDTEYGGGWELVSDNAGVSAMHLILLPTNKAVMFDTFVYGTSLIKLADGNCRTDRKGFQDCWAHAVEYDITANTVRPLKLITDTWCSSGGLAPDGTVVNTGGWFDGAMSVRYLSPCDTCDWKEYPTALAKGQRWYSTQQMLPDGSFVVVGGRRAFSYELVPAAGKSNTKPFDLPFLRQTTDVAENNLYPFVHLSPDGNLFIFANNRAILLNPTTGKILQNYPALDGGSRNYPASGMSALLPLDLRGKDIRAEVLICGGATPEAFAQATNGTFVTALRSCGRIVINKPKPTWAMEDMPVERVMGDMLLLPSTEVLMINGARRGSAGWLFARDPVLEPVLYHPKAARGQRFRTQLAKTEIPRMYHSSSAVMPDASVLVAGSNTNSGYNFTGVMFPTEVRVEKFYPPYLDPLRASSRPTIDPSTVAATVGYGESLQMEFTVETDVEQKDVMVTMYAPPFTTHGFSQNQRLLILKTLDYNFDGFQRFQITVATPPSGAVAPPGYYLVFVVNSGVPSSAVWIRIQ